MRVATKWLAKAMSSLKTAKWHLLVPIFTSTYHTKQPNAWPNSSASCVLNYSRLSACQGELEPFEGNPSTCGCLISLGNKPQQKQPKQLSASIPGRIVNVYNYHLMVKSVSCYCVSGRRLFSNPVTYSDLKM